MLLGPSEAAPTTDDALTYQGNNNVEWKALGSLITPLSDFFNGTFEEPFVASVSATGGVITLSLEQSGGGDLTMRFSDGLTTLDCDPTPQTITLTAGTDASPQGNWVYVLQSTKALTLSTTTWPSAEHIKVAFVLCPSAAFVEGSGAYINQNWNEERDDTTNQGHLSHIGRKIRHLGSTWFSGVDPNGGTSSYFTLGAGNTEFISTAGVIEQMHPQTFTAVDTSAGDVLLVKNWSGDAWHDITDLFDIVNDSTGSSIANNKYFNLVFWGIANETGALTSVVINLPGGSYNTQSDATNDVSTFDDFEMPREFSVDSNVGFLICRTTFQMGATWSFVQTDDLRGLTPQTAGGSGVNDHGGLGGLTDDDHTQYILHSLADAADDFLVASAADTFVRKTLAETGAILEGDLDHGNIQGLADDDHTSYHTDARAETWLTALQDRAKVDLVTSAFTHNSSGNWLPVTWSAEDFDDDAMHDTSTNSERITIQTTGTYLIGGNVRFAANATGERGIRVTDGTTVLGLGVRFDAAGSGATQMNVATIHNMTAAEYVQLEVFQNSGGNLNVTVTEGADFWAIRIA
jgi:hypothetical protein